MPEPPSSPKPAVVIPDHELLRPIGRGSYGEVWLARNVLGEYRAVKIIRRDTFDRDRPVERELEGIQKFEPISRTHENQVHFCTWSFPEGFFYVWNCGRGGAGDSNQSSVLSGQSAASATRASPGPSLNTDNCSLILTLQRRSAVKFGSRPPPCRRMPGLTLKLTNALMHLTGTAGASRRETFEHILCATAQARGIGLVRRRMRRCRARAPRLSAARRPWQPAS